MGWSRQFYEPEPTPAEKGAATKARNKMQREADERQCAAEQDVAAKRMALADKIVLAVVDRISADIIRPGPKPEERECYVMAQELREHSSHLNDLVAAILAVEQAEGL